MRTQRILFILFIFCITSQLKAQNSAVTNAILYQRDGNLVKAKQQIDLAEVHDKTKGSAKTWYYKGLIYSDIYKSDDVSVKELAGDALMTSTDAYYKSIELEKNPSGEYTPLAMKQLEENWVNLVNRGIAYYQTKKNQNALDMFAVAQKIKPTDTTAFIYGTYAAEALKKVELVQEFSNKLLKMNYKSLYVYSNTITYAMDQKNYTKAIELCNQALNDFPLENTVLQYRTLAYIQAGKASEGIESLKLELKTKPYNIELNTSLAVFYNELKDLDKALEVYNRIIAVEPHNFFANYNAAVINLNKGNELAKKNDKPGSIALFKKSLENAKRAKALAFEDDDIDTLNKLIIELNSLTGN